MVDDNPSVLETICTVLASARYEILTADSGSAALQLCREHDGPIHLLLTDINMPEMDGPTLAERIAEHRPAIRLLYMSGEDGPPQAVGPGQALAFLQKPFTPDALFRKIREALTGRA